jgi:putative ABC transport system permease protein
MWSNYLTVGVRALTKNRIHAFINIFGLAIGLAAFLLILLYARYESSYDAWLPEADRLYQLQTINTDAESGTVERMQMSPMAATRAFARDFPEVELAAYVTNSQPVISSASTTFRSCMAAARRLWPSPARSRSAHERRRRCSAPPPRSGAS